MVAARFCKQFSFPFGAETSFKSTAYGWANGMKKSFEMRARLHLEDVQFYILTKKIMNGIMQIVFERYICREVTDLQEKNHSIV